VGVEAGQVMIVLATLAISYVLTHLLKLPQRIFIIATSIIIILISISLLI